VLKEETGTLSSFISEKFECEILLVSKKNPDYKQRIKTYGLKHGVHKRRLYANVELLVEDRLERINFLEANERVILERCKSRWEKGAVKEIIAKTPPRFRATIAETIAAAPSRVAIALNCTDDEGTWFSVMDLRSRVAGKTRANRETSKRLPLHSTVRSVGRTIEAFARSIATASRVAYRRKVQPRGPYR